MGATVTQLALNQLLSAFSIARRDSSLRDYDIGHVAAIVCMAV